jgi:hypothetical protein
LRPPDCGPRRSLAAETGFDVPEKRRKNQIGDATFQTVVAIQSSQNFGLKKIVHVLPL